VPYLHAVSDMCTKDIEGPLPHYENAPCEVQWAFGHGLSYSNFTYDKVVASKTLLKYDLDADNQDAVSVQVTVSNRGSVAGVETVLFFSFDKSRSVTPEYKQLRAFEQVKLDPGESKIVSVSIPMEDFRYVGAHDDSHYIFQDGLSFQIGVGTHTDCRVTDDLCTSTISLRLDSKYTGACEAACDLWSSSGCHDLKQSDCWDMCSSIHQDADLEMNNDGW